LFRVIINVTDVFVVASTEHDKSAYVKHNKQKNKKQTKRPQQNMLNQVMSHTNKKAKTKTKDPQQNILSQLMSNTTNKKTKQKGLNRTC
jgi:hypothetical protein